MSDVPFERIDSETLYEGKIFTVRHETFRHADGGEAERELVSHQGAVGVVAVDDEHVWLVRQPREATGTVTLELPAGKLDVEGESPRETAERELAEEIGKAASDWEDLGWFFTSPGFTDERVQLFLATGLSDAEAESDEEERIEIVPWPLGDLEAALAETRDSKTLIGLLELARRRRAG